MISDGGLRSDSIARQRKHISGYGFIPLPQLIPVTELFNSHASGFLLYIPAYNKKRLDAAEIKRCLNKAMRKLLFGI
ncbi:conserved hypothetical protein [Ricinus communis]|uniref:Uncharacterized protein n=1 Tax=Ricinus communis TaxID=3988 RepID=B9RNY2_RICCO|nr:conserved hypothetical protein [Ricinus communis]